MFYISYLSPSISHGNPTIVMTAEDLVRSNLARLAVERGHSYATLSRAIGRNAAYIHQFITRGSPKRLEESDRRKLAAMLACDEAELGTSGDQGMAHELVRVPRLAVEASAGPGAIVDDESAYGHFGFPKHWLRALSVSDKDKLSIIQIKGDSMSPTLRDGDEALIDSSRCDPRREEGIYVLRRDDTLIVKRLCVSPDSDRITISSDNPAFPTFHDCPADALRIIGRLIASIGRL